MRTTILKAIAAALLLTLFGCKDREAKEKALAEWRRHEANIEGAMRGPSVVEDFMESVVFFRNLTGISIRGDGTFIGLLPNRYTAQDLEKVRDWCRRNCDHIYWDEKSQSVLVKD